VEVLVREFDEGKRWTRWGTRWWRDMVEGFGGQEGNDGGVG
jgi:hypothetical protein